MADLRFIQIGWRTPP
ncbi:hypothetical protein YPPY101_4879, partial [Yersinia pestis PY-101]